MADQSTSDDVMLLVQRLAEKGEPQKDIAELLGVSEPTIVRWKSSRVKKAIPDSEVKRTKLLARCEQLGISGDLPGRASKKDWVVAHNRILRDVGALTAGFSKLPDVSVEYAPDPLARPKELAAMWATLARRVEERARQPGMPRAYRNLGNTRLISVTQQDRVSQRRLPVASGGIHLQLGPVSWEEYCVLNTLLDEPDIIPNSTIRATHASIDKLREHQGDLSWCQLSNILPVAIVPITNDGFALVRKRQDCNVGTTANCWTSGISENIDRFLDEPDGSNIRRLHRIDAEADARSTVDYNPSSAPSPYLAAQRGMREEVSKDMGDRLPIDCYSFLCVSFNFKLFHPVLSGIAELPLSREEAAAMRERSPGTDRAPEGREWSWVDLKNRRDVDQWLVRTDWDATGLGAFGSAVNYWYSGRPR